MDVTVEYVGNGFYFGTVGQMDLTVEHLRKMDLTVERLGKWILLRKTWLNVFHCGTFG